MSQSSARVGISCAETAMLCAELLALLAVSPWREYEIGHWKGIINTYFSSESINSIIALVLPLFFFVSIT